MPITPSMPLLDPKGLRKSKPPETVEQRLRKIRQKQNDGITPGSDGFNFTRAPAYTMRTRVLFGLDKALGGGEKYEIFRRKSFSDRRSCVGFPAPSCGQLERHPRLWSERDVVQWMTDAFLRRECGMMLDLIPLGVSGAELVEWSVQKWAEKISPVLAIELCEELRCKTVQFEANHEFDDGVRRGVDYTLYTSPKWKIGEKNPAPVKITKVPGPGHYKQPSTIGMSPSGKTHPLWKKEGIPVFGLDVRFPAAQLDPYPGPGSYPTKGSFEGDPTRETAPKWSLSGTPGGAFA
ncbi:unnamed protein product [Amoebophrya sp. A25]|nr:unnamed protein product [Amoebophrya sp. A25]|eukprot:GSA25T00013921001.1